MEELSDFNCGLFIDLDDEEEEFRSCFAEEDEWRDTEELVEGGSKHEIDEFSTRLFFKGVSLSQDGDPGHRASGIGVVIERSKPCSVHHVQKKLDFYVEESVAEHLALMDGLLEALRSDTTRVLAYTDSEIVYDQIVQGKMLENQLLTALAQRILEHAGKLESFVLKLVASSELLKPLQLAKDAIGSSHHCPICREEKAPSQMIKMNCSHIFCGHCMTKYVEGKLCSSQVLIRCPQLRCRHYITAIECKSFLPAACYESFLRALQGADVLDSEKIYCPYPDCSVLLDLRRCLSTWVSSSSQSETSCVECPECQRFVCINCSVPWHPSMSCEEYQNLLMEERDAGDITLHRLAQNQQWRQCPQCRHMIELTQGCYHMTCWCGHEFCYSCGADYHDGQQTCQCAFWDDESLVSQSPRGEPEPWRWDDFDSIPAAIDRYSDQERSQLALIQRFLAGGFSLSDYHADQSPPRCSDSYVDTIKDLHQLPWLERFVSVISDNYYEDYVQ